MNKLSIGVIKKGELNIISKKSLCSVVGGTTRPTLSEISITKESSESIINEL